MHLPPCHTYIPIWIVFVDVFEDCNQYDLTTDADIDDADNDDHPNKRKQKRKADCDFLCPSEGMKSICLFEGHIKQGWHISSVNQRYIFNVYI